MRAQLTLATSLRHTQVRSYLSLHLVIPTSQATARLRYSQAVSLPQLLQAPPTDQSRRRAVAGLAAPAAQQYATTQHIIQRKPLPECPTLAGSVAALGAFAPRVGSGGIHTERGSVQSRTLHTLSPYSGGIVVRPWAVREAGSKWRAMKSGLSRPAIVA